MKLNNRFAYGILSLLLAAVIAFAAIPLIMHSSSGRTKIVRVKNDIPSGTLISEDALELVAVGKYNLPKNIAKSKNEVVGTYAMNNLVAGDYILSTKVSSSPVSSDPSLDAIPDGMMAISITTKTPATSLSNKLQSGDIIRLYYYNEKDEVTPVKDMPELRFVKLLSASDQSGTEINGETAPESEDIKPQTDSITVLVAPKQAMLLTQLENEGILHAALIHRGNDKLSEELLKQQTDILK